MAHDGSTRPSWAKCLADGMTAGQAAQARGMTIAAACMWAKRNGKAWPPATPEQRSASARRAAKNGRPRVNRTPAELTADETEAYRTYRFKGWSKRNALLVLGRRDLVESMEKTGG